MSIRISRLPFMQHSKKCYHSSNALYKSHYDTLGLTPKATQSDVKSAFYRLSKMYHPDTNANDPNAAEKFREVLEAYEILSNSLARTEYDRGSTNPSTSAVKPATKGFKAPEDPQAAFYKSRLMRRMESSATQKFNFDVWAQSHYSNSFQRRDPKASESNYKRNAAPFNQKKEVEQAEVHQPMAVTSIIIVTLSLLGIGWLANSMDQPRSKR